MRRILIVEDDEETRNYVKRGFSDEGYSVQVADNGRDGLYLATDGSFDAIVLDRMLPELDGLSVLKSLRAAGVKTPVLLLTAVSAVDERVKGLRYGADDYLVKPFSLQELLARLEALLRRPQEQATISELSCQDLEMDLIRRSVKRGERPIELTQREFQILEFFLRRKNRVVTRSMLLEGVWGYHFDPQTNVVDVHVSKLRKQIDGADETPLLRTVRGAGYMLQDD
ncbi:response regulator transcription factor [Tateyamaria pelophila]|uniref:response regulator transcription factor n=1 Tax=Tateyamaria pelophila TaxID=328415 RepID=UPI001CBEC903|nr:response regulator transcription factor [Tateyamaria pelophila]